MNNNSIEILGITPPSDFPICHPHHPCTQICQTDKLFLSCEQDIKKILKLIVTVSICSFKIINTPIGKKVVVHGIKHIKVISAIEKECKCTHSACFDIPFCLFIMLKDFNAEIMKICAVVEDISVQCLKHQFLLVSIIIFACPIFKHEKKCDHPECIKTCNCNEKDHDSCSHKHCTHDDYNNCQNQHECNTTCNCNEMDHNFSNQKYYHHDSQHHCPMCHDSRTLYHQLPL